MANTFAAPTANNSLAASAPTGKVNIVSGVTNITKHDVKANQQILIGDPLFQNNASNTFVALPAQVASATSDTSNAIANNTLQLGIANSFLGFATTYRSPKNTSAGKPSDVVGVGCGRVRVPINQNNATSFSNNTGVGQLWGVACTQNNQFNGTSTPLQNSAWVLQGPDGQPVYDIVGHANHAVGRQALPRLAGDAFVTLDTFSTLLGPGVNTIPT